MVYERLQVHPISATRNAIARLADHRRARRAAGGPSDDGHPGQHLDAVGIDRLLAGRLITGRAAAAGALSGLWAGLLTGILFGLFTGVNTWIAMLVAGLGLGVLCGATLAIAAHLAIRGQRGLGSLRGLSARHDDATARPGGAEPARDRAGQAGLVPPDTPAA